MVWNRNEKWLSVTSKGLPYTLKWFRDDANVFSVRNGDWFIVSSQQFSELSVTWNGLAWLINGFAQQIIWRRIRPSLRTQTYFRLSVVLFSAEPNQWQPEIRLRSQARSAQIESVLSVYEGRGERGGNDVNDYQIWRESTSRALCSLHRSSGIRFDFGCFNKLCAVFFLPIFFSFNQTKICLAARFIKPGKDTKFYWHL